MKQKVHYIILLFFLPVIQKFIIAKPINIAMVNLLFDFKFFGAIVIILFLIRIVAIIYFWAMFFNWVWSGFKLKKLLPCILSLFAIFFLNYSIKAIINNTIKRFQNKIQKIPNALIKRNTQIPKIWNPS